VTFKTGASGGTIRTGVSAADKFQLQAYDVDGAAYVKVLEADAGNSPTMEVYDGTFQIRNTSDEAKHVIFDISGATTSTTTTLTASQTADRVLTLPDATDTLVGKATTDTLTGKTINLNANTITGTTALFNVALSDDNFATLTNSVVLTNKTIDADNNTISNLAHGAEVDNPSSGVHGVTGSVVGTSDTQTLTNKTLSDSTTYLVDNSDTTKKLQVECSGITASTTRTWTAVDYSGKVPVVVAEVNLTGQTASITSTNLLASAPAGSYIIAWSIGTSTTGGAGNTVGTFYWTDDGGSWGRAMYDTDGGVPNGPSAASVETANGSFHFFQPSSGNITYDVTRGGTSTFFLRVRLIYLGA